jgi:CRP/FNR family cyclic AMP-dependent transcriptional regulator
MTPSTKLWYLERFDLFKNLQEIDLQSIEEGVLIKSIQKNEIIRFPRTLNKYVYFLKKGAFKVVASDDEGHEVIKYLIRPGNLFGEIPLLNKVEREDCHAEALEDSIVCFINVDKLKQWMQDNNELLTKINKQLGERILRIENRLLSQLFKDAQTRISDFLREFVKDFGTKEEDGYRVKNILTHEDIGKLTASSRQTVTQVLNELRDKEIIAYDKKYLFIPFNSPLLLNNPVQER